MTLGNRRARARKLNDPDAPDPVEKSEDDGVSREELSFDFSGVVEDDTAEKQEQLGDLAKSIGENSNGIDFREVFKDEDGGGPESIELDYSGLLKSKEESRREKDAAAIGEAVADELDRRGFTGNEDAAGVEKDADAADAGDDGDAVEKAERTVDLLGDVQEDVRQLKRVESFKQLEEEFRAAGGNDDSTVQDLMEWYGATSDAAVAVGGTHA
jgi:hypothetical protein